MKNKAQNHFGELQRFILDEEHPCVMAQAVFHNTLATYVEYENFGSKQNVKFILADLEKYIASTDIGSNDFQTFIAAFPNEQIKNEEIFEKLLWQQLQHLHEADNNKWDPKVDKDPKSEKFSFSLKGHAFFIIGMHPKASRKSRRSPFPCIAFNFHWQFEKLREMNVYSQVKARIRERDAQLQGNINPMLADYGEESEVYQYSGRQVEKNWKCPFHHK